MVLRGIAWSWVEFIQILSDWCDTVMKNPKEPWKILQKSVHACVCGTHCVHIYLATHAKVFLFCPLKTVQMLKVKYIYRQLFYYNLNLKKWVARWVYNRPLYTLLMKADEWIPAFEYPGQTKQQNGSPEIFMTLLFFSGKYQSKFKNILALLHWVPKW